MSEETNAQQPQGLEPWFLELLACPVCPQHHPVTLTETKDALLCKCGRYSFPVRDGIPILLKDEATLLDENADPATIPVTA